MGCIRQAFARGEGGSCEHGNKLSVSIKRETFFDGLSDPISEEIMLYLTSVMLKESPITCVNFRLIRVNQPS